MLTRGRVRQARPTPAAGPLPPGFIDTGDLMPGEGTRVDVVSPGYRESLRRAAMATQVKPAPTVARAPAVPLSRTVYASLNRPELITHNDWRDLCHRVDLAFRDEWIVQRAGTPVDTAAPMTIWVLIIPVDRVVDVQAQILAALASCPRTARLIWAEASPRTIGGG